MPEQNPQIIRFNTGVLFIDTIGPSGNYFISGEMMPAAAMLVIVINGKRVKEHRIEVDQLDLIINELVQRRAEINALNAELEKSQGE